MTMFEKPLDVVKRVEEVLEVSVEPIILRSQIHELEKIANSDKRLKVSRIARAVLQYVKGRFSVVEDCGGIVDDVLLEVSKREGYIVATNDRELRRKLRSNGVSVIYLRSDGKVEIEGFQP